MGTGGGNVPLVKEYKSYVSWRDKKGRINTQDHRAFKGDMYSGTVPSMERGIPKVLIPEATKKGYKEAYEGDGIYINRPHQKRGVVQKDMIQTLKTSGNDLGVVVGKSIKPSVAKNFEREKEEIANSDKDIYQAKSDSGWQDNKVGLKTSPTIRANNNHTSVLDNNLRIRKLTPKECFRLMGFSDEDFDKASQVNSNSQLYKQAGNSIVVNVLEKILERLV